MFSDKKKLDIQILQKMEENDWIESLTFELKKTNIVSFVPNKMKYKSVDINGHSIRPTKSL